MATAVSPEDIEAIAREGELLPDGFLLERSMESASLADAGVEASV